MNRLLSITLVLLSCVAGLLPIGVAEPLRTSENSACVECEELCPCCAQQPGERSAPKPACPCAPVRDTSETRGNPTPGTIVSTRAMATRTIAKRPRQREGYAAVVDHRDGAREADRPSERTPAAPEWVRRVDRIKLCSWVV